MVERKGAVNDFFDKQEPESVYYPEDGQPRRDFEEDVTAAGGKDEKDT